MPTQSNTENLPQVMETIFVGSALKDVSAEIMDKDVPVRTRHMRSIDDLLMHVEDNDVQCVVVDQSLPTESRGVKLVLLAGIKKVKHLIVIASPDSRTEIASIDGVHKVLCSPASHEQIIDAMLGQTRQAAPATVAATSSTLAAQAVRSLNASPGIGTRLVRFCEATSDFAHETVNNSTLYNWTGLSRHLSTRTATATVACLFVCLSIAATLSLASGSSMMSVEPAGIQPVAERSQIAPDEAAGQPYSTSQSNRQSLSALQAAELSRRDAASRLQASLHIIDLEILQQRGLQRELAAHIARLNSIVADLNAAHDDNSLNPGGSVSLKSLKRLADVKIELALQELEVSKINNILGNLNLLKSEINPPATDALKLADIRPPGNSN